VFLKLIQYKRFYSKNKLGSRFQIPKQALEGRAVAVVVFPPAEVSDVPRAADVGGPGLACLHDRIVETDRKKNGLLLALFFFKCGFDFLLHPRTFDRLLGENEQQLVIDANRFIDDRTDFVADLVDEPVESCLRAQTSSGHRCSGRRHCSKSLNTEGVKCL